MGSNFQQSCRLFSLVLLQTIFIIYNSLKVSSSGALLRLESDNASRLAARQNSFEVQHAPRSLEPDKASCLAACQNAAETFSKDTMPQVVFEGQHAPHSRNPQNQF